MKMSSFQLALAETAFVPATAPLKHATLTSVYNKIIYTYKERKQILRPTMINMEAENNLEMACDRYKIGKELHACSVPIFRATNYIYLKTLFFNWAQKALELKAQTNRNE